MPYTTVATPPVDLWPCRNSGTPSRSGESGPKCYHEALVEPLERRSGMSDAPSLFRMILHVSGTDRAAGFYSTLLGTPGRRVAPTRYYFDCGSVILALVDP